jgi:hypothetical protein
MRQKNPDVSIPVILKLLGSQWRADPNLAASYAAKAESVRSGMLAARKLTAAPKGIFTTKNAFFFFVQQTRSEYSSIKRSEVNKIAGERWKSMPEDEKNSWIFEFKMWRDSMSKEA